MADNTQITEEPTYRLTNDSEEPATQADITRVRNDMNTGLNLKASQHDFDYIVGNGFQGWTITDYIIRLKEEWQQAMSLMASKEDLADNSTTDQTKLKKLIMVNESSSSDTKLALSTSGTEEIELATMDDFDKIESYFTFDWEGTWERGGINASGATEESTSILRTASYIPSRDFTATLDNAYSFQVVRYDEDKKFIKKDNWVIGSNKLQYATKDVAGTKFMKFLIKKNDGSNLTDVTLPKSILSVSMNGTDFTGKNNNIAMDPSVLNDVVQVSDTKPTSAINEIWVKPNSSEIEIPTMDEFEGAIESINDRLDNVPTSTEFDKLVDGAVRHDIEQTINDAGKERARGNIGAASQSDFEEVAGDVEDLNEALSKNIISIKLNNIFPLLWSVRPSFSFYNTSTHDFADSGSHVRVCPKEVILVNKDIFISPPDEYEICPVYFNSIDHSDYKSIGSWTDETILVSAGNYITICLRKESGTALELNDFSKIYSILYADNSEFIKLVNNVNTLQNETHSNTIAITVFEENNSFVGLWTKQPTNYFFDVASKSFKVSNTMVRACVTEVIKIPDALTISIADGYQYNISYFNSVNTSDYFATSGWTSDDIVLHKDEYISVTVRKTDNTSFDPSEFWNVYSVIFVDKNTLNQSIDKTVTEIKHYLTTNIVNLNSDAIDSLVQSKRRINTTRNTYTNKPPILTLLHFSDIHKDDTALMRLVEFKNAVSDFVDDTICTGDMVTTWGQGMDWWNNVTGTSDIITCIGNHEISDTVTANHDYGDPHSISDAYERYMSQYIGNWGVTYTSGKTYFYKDYPDSKIRLIVLDSMIKANSTDISDQNTWLSSTLSSAATLGYSVIIGTHFSQRANQVKLASNFTSIDTTPVGGVLLDAYISTVQDFIDNGGDFICYLSGHEHLDCILYDTNYPDQIVISIGECKCESAWGDVHREVGQKSQDLFNLVSFDTYAKNVKIVRVGADRDCYLKHRSILVLNWKTKQIIYSD